MNRLKLGSAVLISGGTSGLGLNLAYDLTKKGKSVVICGRNLDALHKVTEKLSEFKKNDQLVLGLVWQLNLLCSTAPVRHLGIPKLLKFGHQHR